MKTASLFVLALALSSAVASAAPSPCEELQPCRVVADVRLPDGSLALLEVDTFDRLSLCRQEAKRASLEGFGDIDEYGREWYYPPESILRFEVRLLRTATDR